MAGDFAARNGCGHRAALAVAHHDDEADMKVLDGVFHASDDVIIEDVPGVTDDEQTAQALIEEQLRGNSRVGAGEDNREGVWPLACSSRRSLVWSGCTAVPATKRWFPLSKPFESMFGRQGSQRVFICTSCRSRHRRGCF